MAGLVGERVWQDMLEELGDEAGHAVPVEGAGRSLRAGLVDSVVLV